MLAKIGSFAFIMNESHFKQIEETFTYHYAEHKQIGNDSTFHDVSGRTHAITLRGLLVQRPMDTLKPLIEIADKKEPVKLSTKTDDYNVLIKSIRRTKDKFNKDGSFMVQSFDLALVSVSSQNGSNRFGIGLGVGTIVSAIGSFT